MWWIVVLMSGERVVAGSRPAPSEWMPGMWWIDEVKSMSEKGDGDLMDLIEEDARTLFVPLSSIAYCYQLADE